MTHKKIIKRENGDVVEIKVRFQEFGGNRVNGNQFVYDVDVEIMDNGEKTWYYEFTAATPDEIYAAKLELWELLKPIK